MKRAVVLALGGVVCIALKAGAGDPVKDDLDRLQGEWVPVNWIVDGKEVPGKGEQKNFTFAGNKLTANDQAGTFTIDPTKRPKRLDVSLPLVKGNWSYQLEGDRLIIAFGKVGEKAPTDFEGRPGNPVLILKRKPK